MKITLRKVGVRLTLRQIIPLTLSPGKIVGDTNDFGRELRGFANFSHSCNAHRKYACTPCQHERHLQHGLPFAQSHLRAVDKTLSTVPTLQQKPLNCVIGSCRLRDSTSPLEMRGGSRSICRTVLRNALIGVVDLLLGRLRAPTGFDQAAGIVRSEGDDMQEVGR